MPESTPLRLTFIRMLSLLLMLIGTCAVKVTVYGQSFKLMRFDESYSQLADSPRTFYNRLKYLPLSKKSAVYLSFGGSARAEYVDFHNEDWGRIGTGHNNFLLQRYDLHTDLHLGEQFRVFGQIRSTWESGRKNGPRPIDEDRLNIQNFFLDFKAIHRESATIILRLGRQELDYGSGRLVSVREGPNLRLYFTGGKVMFSTKNTQVDAFVMMADTINTGAFDNKLSHQANLWGLYSKFILDKTANLDFYYLGIRRNESSFEEGNQKEIRHTLGSRIWKYGGGFIYNLEAALQLGKFGQGNISAWTGSIDVGYLFEDVKYKPSVNLRNDYISGDQQAGDGSLQSFNPLYPKGGYFGFSPQIGPVNLIDIHPYITLNPSPKILIQMDVVMNWRYSVHDGVYRPSGGFNLAGSPSAKRYIGTAYLASMVYNFNRFISLNTGFQYFKTGPFISDIVATPRDGIFINSRLSLKF